MSGDYYRYLSEVRPHEYDYKQKSLKNYDESMEYVNKLSPTHPTRLGLLLSYAVQYYEILDEPEKAIEIAKRAFDEAIEKLDTLIDVSYKDSTLIMQLLRDNLTLWNSEEEVSKREKKKKQREMIVDGYIRMSRNELDVKDMYEIPNIVNRICKEFYK